MVRHNLTKSTALEIIQTCKLGMEHSRLSGDTTSNMMFEKILNIIKERFPYKQKNTILENFNNLDFDPVQYQFKKERGLL